MGNVEQTLCRDQVKHEKNRNSHDTAKKYVSDCKLVEIHISHNQNYQIILMTLFSISRNKNAKQHNTNVNSLKNLTSPNRYEHFRLSDNSANSLFQNNIMDIHFKLCITPICNQPAFTSSNLIKAPEQGMKYVQS